ncbi:Spo7-like protein-domain-containing protein [Mucor mucedo]|uniref:Transmembrane protein 188 n=1 Tax=Mucor saturninus TaxID=64648 RepID=A0A8H7QQZ7_9FUNG|nr:Spo7-like protein-domain-containing protein [Mucor mucedo]KAG2196924.1 hypothetical protein INT47_005148 [Mucor saturninus]KAI7888611.1 Spo7-like protein-domain-containing protein [Mucor mucedo]
MSAELNKDGIASRQRTNQSNQTMYRDLVIFEERLRGNMTRLVKRKRKYETLLVSLFVVLTYFFYAVFFDPSKVFMFHLLNTVALLAVAGGLVFFYRSGMYSEKIVYAQKFVPHCNNALQAFNLEFNRGGLSFLERIPRQFKEGFESYRKQYHQRKKARQAKLKKART